MIIGADVGYDPILHQPIADTILSLLEKEEQREDHSLESQQSLRIEEASFDNISMNKTPKPRVALLAEEIRWKDIYGWYTETLLENAKQLSARYKGNNLYNDEGDDDEGCSTTRAENDYNPNPNSSSNKAQADSPNLIDTNTNPNPNPNPNLSRKFYISSETIVLRDRSHSPIDPDPNPIPNPDPYLRKSSQPLIDSTPNSNPNPNPNPSPSTVGTVECKKKPNPNPNPNPKKPIHLLTLQRNHVSNPFS
jgi:hypothetical protein